MSRSPIHLVSRFFDVALSRPLDPTERATVALWLEPKLFELFRQQPVADQRHAYRGAQVVVEAGREDLCPAVLMHDVGKRHSGLGVFGRVFATLAAYLGISGGNSFRVHNNHGPIGAKELEKRNADELVVEFAHFHAGERPESIDPETWDLLLMADSPPKPRALLSGR
ncbi:MAG: hypothetical protein GEU79_00280 [Acidimicrobiia bacterium]|nr:hypothetical protein [Acidimicrobiia bacterium]